MTIGCRTATADEQKLQQQFQRCTQIEMGDGFHGHPRVVMLPSVHALNYIVGVIAYIVTSDFCFNEHSRALKIDDAIVQKAIRYHF